MRLRYLFFYFLAVTSVVPALAQDVPGSSIVSRTFLSPDGMRKAVQRVYDNGLGDIVQEIQSYQGSALPNTVVSHECIKGTGKLIRYQGREISQEILCHD